MWRTTSRVWCGVLNSIGRGLFIGVQGGVTNLITSVTCQVLASWPRHMVSQPLSPASIDLRLQIPCCRLLESVPVKQTRDSLQSGAARSGSLIGRPPPRPTGQWPLHTASSCQVHSCGDPYFCVILIFLVIS
jgi:hypothetical protein